jgi:hypothetical protein
MFMLAAVLIGSLLVGTGNQAAAPLLRPSQMPESSLAIQGASCFGRQQQRP